MRLDPHAIIRAIYRDAESDEDWLGGVVRASVTGNASAFAYTYATDERGVRFSSMVDSGPVFPGWRDELERSIARAPSVVDTFFRRTWRPRWAFRNARGSIREWGDQFMGATRSMDVLLTTRTDPTGVGVALGFPSSRPRDVGPRTLQLLGCLVAHLNAARRLRAALGTSWSCAPVEGVLDSSGTLVHAEGTAKEPAQRVALARAQRARARFHVRTASAAEALTLWRALVAGRWTLVDHVERDGRRFVLARKNDPAVGEPRRLTPNERAVASLAATGQSNKSIAYDLGLAPTTVATHLASALRKLGIGTRSELARLFARGEG